MAFCPNHRYCKLAYLYILRTKAFPGADVSRGSTNADGTRVGEESGLVDLHINI